jgi:hypothetical protein
MIEYGGRITAVASEEKEEVNIVGGREDVALEGVLSVVAKCGWRAGSSIG